MAKDDKGDGKSKPAKKKGGHPFCYGLLFGLLVGIVLGWWFRPPSSFKLDQLKEATASKMATTKDTSREKLAEWAQGLANSLKQR